MSTIKVFYQNHKIISWVAIIIFFVILLGSCSGDDLKREDYLLNGGGFITSPGSEITDNIETAYWATEIPPTPYRVNGYKITGEYPLGNDIIWNQNVNGHFVIGCGADRDYHVMRYRAISQTRVLQWVRKDGNVFECPGDVDWHIRAFSSKRNDQ